MNRVLTKPGLHLSRVLRLTAWTFFSFFLIGYVAGWVVLALGLTFNPFRDSGPDTPAPYEEVAFPGAAGDNLTLRGWWVPNPANKGAHSGPWQRLYPRLRPPYQQTPLE